MYIKRLSIVLLVLLVSSTTMLVDAQKIFSFGVKAGYNMTLKRVQPISPSENPTFEIQHGFQNGFNVGIYGRIGRRFYLQPEVQYHYFAYNSQVPDASANAERKKYVVSTVDVPILVGYTLVDADMFKLRVMAGPRFSFNAGSTKPNSWSEFTESTRDTRIGLDCGLGFDVWRFNLDVRYNLFSDMYKLQTAEGIMQKGKVLNQFEISLGFRIFGRNVAKSRMSDY